MPRLGHRFDTEEIAQGFAEFCERYNHLRGHIVRTGRVVGLDDETADKMNADGTAIHFVLMTNAFDGGVEFAQCRHLFTQTKAA